LGIPVVRGPVDHSLTYRQLRLRNIPHRIRLRKIRHLLNEAGVHGSSWADVGCSNGYIIADILKRHRPLDVCGFDRSEAQLAKARELLPSVRFVQLDLLASDPPHDRFDVVSCFETLEHVGNLRKAIGTLLDLTEPEGRLVITVPIESGWRGGLKFAVKTSLYGYSLDELPQRPSIYRQYCRALILRSRVSVFRAEERRGWATHFGFEWRDLDELLRTLGLHVKRRVGMFTVYYVITR
jgi:SAM-dependent methyltransferase